MNAIQPIVFDAAWTEQNQHLRVRTIREFTIGELIHGLFQGPLYWASMILKERIQPLLGRYLIVQSASWGVEVRRRIQAAWEARWAENTENRLVHDPVPLDLTTPDGVRIRGVFYRNKWAGHVDIPTFVMHMPNAGLHKEGLESLFLNKHGRHGHDSFNVVCYDYRGTGESEGEPLSAAQLALDGDTVHQCLRQQGISEENIRHFGRSLGGGVSALVRAMHPSNAPYVNCHSFASMTRLITDTHHAEDLLNLGEPEAREHLPPWLADLLFDIFTPDVLIALGAWLFSLCGWEFNVAPALQQIGQDALVIYDPEDELMQGVGANTVDGPQKLQVGNPIPRDPLTLAHHNLPLSEGMCGNGKPGDDAMIEFLLSERAHS